MTLFDHIAEWLDHEAVRFAVIGAGALAVQEITGSTLDQELLVADRRVLNRPFWKMLQRPIEVEAEAGPPDHALAGHVRLSAAGERPVDILIAGAIWVDGILDRRVTIPVPGRDLPVASLPDVILLKLYAGGTEDVSEIAQVLEAADSPALREDVESRLSFLPPDCAMLWQQILTTR